MSLLSCRNLTRRPWFEALAIELDAGEIAVLRGPTGSGKTLFMRGLADLDPVDDGEVFLENVSRESMSAPDWRRSVLYLRQNAAAHCETVSEEYQRIGALAGSPQHSGEWSSVLPLDRDCAQLSGGELQWLALERGLLIAPRVLLLDEASSALDSQSAARFEKRVLDYVAAGNAALWVAHDAQLAGRLGAREIQFP